MTAYPRPQFESTNIGNSDEIATFPAGFTNVKGKTGRMTWHGHRDVSDEPICDFPIEMKAYRKWQASNKSQQWSASLHAFSPYLPKE